MRRLVLLLAVLAAAVTAAIAAAVTRGAPVPAEGLGPPPPSTLAIIGDSPYGAAQLVAFPGLVDRINADPNVSTVLHLGDVKNGSSVCSDSYFEQIRTQFDRFQDPLLYTPGDNEWTDCHRANNGAYFPGERLARLRQLFYPEAGVSLGVRKLRVTSQTEMPGYERFVENQLFVQSGAVFSMLHVVGSNNDLQPWFAAGETPEQRAERIAEYNGRIDADLAWLDRTFALAASRGAPGVVVAMQADMWDAFSVLNRLPLNGFDPIVQRLAVLAREFGKPVLVLQGDSHRFTVDRPLANGSPVHNTQIAAPNLTRIVVEGETASEYLRLRVDATSPAVFSYERVRLP